MTDTGPRHISVSLETFERLAAVAQARSIPIAAVLEDVLAPAIGRDDARRDRRLRAWSRPTMTVEGASLRAWRLAQGWSQIDLAARLGVLNTTVSKWEIGRTRPVGRLAAALVDLGWERAAAPVQPPPSDDREAFGRALATWRFGSGRTQKRLAAEIGVAASKLCRVEQGHGALNDVQIAVLTRLGFAASTTRRAA